MARLVSRRRDHAINAAGSFLVPACSFLATPLLARALGPSGQGYFANDQALLLLTSNIIALGVGDATAVYWTRWTRRLRRSVSAVNLSSAAVLAVFAAWYVAAVQAADTSEVLLMVAGSVVMAVAMQIRGISLSDGDVRSVGFEKWLTSLGRLGLTSAFFAAGNLSVPTALIALLAPQAAGACLLAVRHAIVRARVDEAEPEVSQTLAPRPWVTIGWAVAGGMGGVLLVNVDSAILLPLIGPEQLGYYAIAVLLAEVYTTAARPFREAVVGADGSKLRHVVATTQRMCLLVLGAGSCLALAVLWWAVPAVFGASFRPATPVVYVMVLGGLAKGLAFWANGVLMRANRARVRAVSTLVAFAINLLLLATLFRFGALGAAVAASISYAVMYLWSQRSVSEWARQAPVTSNSHW